MDDNEMASETLFYYRLSKVGELGDQEVNNGKTTRIKRVSCSKRRTKVRIPSLKKFLQKRRKFRLFSAFRKSRRNVLKRWKESRSKFGDLFAAHKPWHSLNTATATPHQFTKPPIPAKMISTTVFSSSSSSNNNNNNNSQKTKASSAGNVKRLVLSQEGRTKLNPASDRDFYAYPRFVKHVDDAFISTLTDLCRERLRPGWEILDLMSSWVSHLPEEVEYKRVVGHGLNAQELARNPRLDYFFVKDLNKDQQLQLEDSSFDAVLCTVSVQYLQQPEKVFAEVFRVLKPGGVFIVSFSNRMFYEKAIGAWREGTGYSRVQLVVQYFQCVEGFLEPEIIRKIGSIDGVKKNNSSPFDWVMRLMGLALYGPDPFYAVIAHKNFKPIYE